jgi:ERI1 exoribonuclease 3
MESIPKQNLTENSHDFDYLLVLDFEAQCDNDTKLKCQEIIEFPVVIVDVVNKKILDNFFHFYIKPEVHSKLFPFCTELTGITQDLVDGGILLKECLEHLDKFLNKEKLTNFTFVTCGDWDLNTCLPKEAFYKNIEYRDYLKSWINVKRIFSEISAFKVGMAGMLRELGLKLDGRHHSGLDDAKNIAKIVLNLINKGLEFKKSKMTILKGSKEKKPKKVREKMVGMGK